MEATQLDSLTTKRLLVTRVKAPPTELCHERDVFLARWRSIDQPEVVAHATVNCCGPLGPYLDWLEVNDRFRRQGVGTEFRAAIEIMVGEPLNSTAGSEDGRMFREALGLEE